METMQAIQNWRIARSASVLKEIRKQDVNIAIYEREVASLVEDVKRLVNKDVEIRHNGTISEIMLKVRNELASFNCNFIADDIEFALEQFAEVSEEKSFRLLLETVTTNMCRRFHSDINEQRMLCTYAGPGTLWLKEQNINRMALNSAGNELGIVKSAQDIQQVKTGALVILKGALYPLPGTKAVVHRSPEVEATGDKRLMLRIDINENLFT